jgi:hypothetical protein
MTRTLLLGLIVMAAGTATARAGDCCAHCGCNSCCRKVCRLVCETKKVPKTTYDCKCEDFCVPGPSKCVGACETCSDCDKCGGCGCKWCTHKKKIYEPTCACVHTKKVLVKHVEMEEKKSYKWVVEYLCDNCACKCQQAQPQPGGGDLSVPPAPGDAPVPPAPPAPQDNTASRSVTPSDYYEGVSEEEMLAPAPPPLTGKSATHGVSFMQSLFNRKPKQ